MNGTRRFSQASWGWDAQEPSKGTGKAEERTFCPASRPQVQSSIREDWASMSAEKALQTLRRGLVHMLPQINKVSTLQTGNRMIPRRAAAKVTRNAPATNSASNFSQLAQRPSYMSNANLRRTGERSEKGKVSILHKVTISIITLSLDSVIYWIRSKEVGSLLSHSS